ncbi:glycosyl transferase [Paenibacillus marchantiophytorum]|uniref:Glycosyl transferase n=1 Tax=Paenibacillus marchantiophytorum TaxID=1619310 RepID=A0ABQ1F5G9_9BACL|nr:hypothetical protein [Paenibacillus marchantiophytorum]GFZ99251.1 glycosyl transferase [Paenibacillus marchantiophytorum]
MGFIGSFLDLIVLAGAAWWLLPHVHRFLEAHQQVELNYAGQSIPRGFGIVLWLLLWLQELMLQFAHVSSLETYHRVYLLAATVIFLIGWTDDLIGSKAIKGFSGHYRYWLDTKTMSMGAVKAVGTLLAAVWLTASYGSEKTPIWETGVGILLLVLMTNTLNLLDVRPGRSLKVYVAMTFLIGVIGLIYWHLPAAEFVPILPVCIGAVCLYKLDIGGRGMLGDAGANLLGFTLGYEVMITFPWWVQALIIVGLLLLHKLAEVSSLTRMIERNRLLNWLDRLGRT